MERFAHTILGYHGCDARFRDALLAGDIDVADWKHSRNEDDWLGAGVYFWEGSPARARRWSLDPARKRKKKDFQPAVVGALVYLGQCFDLTNEQYTKRMATAYEQLARNYVALKKDLPQNLSNKRRPLDYLVLESLFIAASHFQTVRAPFFEGKAAYPGTEITEEAHMQIAVRDNACILGAFRPKFEEDV